MSNSEIQKLEQAIVALEAQRAILGDAVVDTALSPLREKLEALRAVAQAENLLTNQQQRKIVTVLFSEIPAFSSLNEILDPEDLRDTANALWEKLDAIIMQHGGRIDKHLGNGVMALWGANVVSEDDPEQAIRAALMMREAVRAFYADSPVFGGIPDHETLILRTGINTGPAIVGLVGTTGEFTAMGDTVNLAARLYQVSAPGEIRISHDTYSQVRGIFDVEIQPVIQVKGRAEPIKTYLVGQIKPRTFHLRSPGVEGIQTPVIGRQRELDTLQKAFMREFEEPLKQVITVMGEMGLGKSRLLFEFADWAETRPGLWWHFQGRGTPSQSNVPYGLLRDLFAFRFEIQDNDPLSAVQQKMERGFAQFMPDDKNSVEKAHIVGQVLGFDFSASPYLRGLQKDPRQLRSLALSYISRFIISAGKVYPIIFLLDDLHWADSGSLEALTAIFASLPKNTPMLAVCMARPALLERYPSWAANLPASNSMTLAPLTLDESRNLVEQILARVENLPTSVRDLIVSGAEGNPFYLEELIKMLIDGRVIQTGEEKWTVDLHKLNSVTIPPTLAGVLQARLDRLNAIERASLQRASIVGRIFWDSAVEALSPEADTAADVLRTSLSVLSSKELIFSSPVSTFSGTQEFSFKHALLRDVTYETVLKRQRTQYHAMVADWLSGVSGERRMEFLPIIADHYEKAGDLNKAADSLIEAGEHALNISGFNEAFRFFQHAFEIMPEVRLRDKAYLQLKLGEVFLRSGEYADALKYSQKALELTRNFSVTTLYAAALYQNGQIYAEMGEYTRAEQFFNQAIPLAKAAGKLARETLAKLLFGMGNVHWRLGKLETARKFSEESYQMAAEIGESNTMILALNRLGVVKGLLGDHAGEERDYHRCLELAMAFGNRERAAVAYNNLGALADERNELQKAQEHYLKAIDMAREIGAQQSLALYLINLAHSEIRLMSLEDGHRHLQEGLALAWQIGATPWTLTAVQFYARLAAARGDFDQALTILGLIEAHPAFSMDHQRLTEAMLAEWKIPDERILEKMAEGARLNWEQTVLELLS
jgi:class 3 adenylate cyclase/tetratricopeptide (TPR) repeat protein